MNASNIKIPDKMLAVRQYKAGEKLTVESIDVPRPGPGEVLVKMAASPVNPSDLKLIGGGYLERSYPFTPGLEGSGTVVASGGGLLPRLRMGKQVACTPDPKGDGTWAQYMKTSAMRTVPLPPHIDPVQGSMMLVNPMTAMAFIAMAKTGKHRAMVNNAAASALGRMLIRLTGQYGIPLISIVRQESQVTELKNMGATHVLNSTHDAFETGLTRLSGQLDATLFLDAVTGAQTEQLLRAAPRGATLVAYARLSGEPIRVDPGDLIRDEKRIIGFQLGNWMETKSILYKLRFINRVKKQMGVALTTRVNRQFPLEAVESAISLYREHMSDGKMILLIEKKNQ